MDPSYSLHTRVPVAAKPKPRRRKRKVIPIASDYFSSYKYCCYECGADVYFLPGQELVCVACSSRIVQKLPSQHKRIVSSR